MLIYQEERKVAEATETAIGTSARGVEVRVEWLCPPCRESWPLSSNRLPTEYHGAKSSKFSKEARHFSIYMETSDF